MIHGEVITGYTEETAITERNSICDLVKSEMELCKARQETNAEKICKENNLIELLIKGL
jgi:hypothetical protein